MLFEPIEEIYMDSLALRKQLKNRNKQVGFTLVELITVVAIISMIAIYITIEINRSNDDAKVGIATAYLTSSVPAAISSYRARHLGNCNGIDTPSVLENLEDRGMSDTSPWGTTVSATWDGDARQITVAFEIPGGDAGEVGTALLDNLNLSSGQFSDLPESFTEGSFRVTYDCA